MADVKIESTSVVLTTSGSPQQITIPGLGFTPRAAIVRVYVPTVNGTAFQNMEESVGFLADSDGVAFGYYTLHGQSITECEHCYHQSNGSVIIMSRGGSILYKFNGAFIADGIELTPLTPLPADRTCMVTFIGGSDVANVSLHEQFMTAKDTPFTVNTGYPVDLIFAMNTLTNDQGSNAQRILEHAFQTTGICVNDGTDPPPQCFMSHWSDNGRSSGADNRVGLHSARIGARWNNNSWHTGTVQNFTSTGFDIILDGAAHSNIYYHFLAIGFTANKPDLYVAKHQVEQDSGDTVVSGVGFQPTYGELIGWAGQIGTDGRRTGSSHASRWEAPLYANGDSEMRNVIDMDGVSASVSWNIKLTDQVYPYKSDISTTLFEMFFTGFNADGFSALMFKHEGGQFAPGDNSHFIAFLFAPGEGGGGVPFEGVGETGQWEWFGQAGALEAGFIVAGQLGQWEWQGFPGDLINGESIPFIGVGLTGQYEWFGQLGSVLAGAELVGDTGQYEWFGQPGSTIRGHDAFTPDNICIYEWYGFPGRFLNGDSPEITATVLEDCMREALRYYGYTGTTNGMLLKYYQDRGATSDDLRVATDQFLDGLGAMGETTQGKWVNYFESRGLGDNFQDGMRQFWCVLGGDV